MTDNDDLNLPKQHDPRGTFVSEGVRGSSAFALRRMLKEKGLEEGEFISNLFEQAVIKEFGGTIYEGGCGDVELERSNDFYQETLENDS